MRYIIAYVNEFSKKKIMKEESNFEYNLVDLGLPSGTLWMDRNVGANSPSDYGLYFAWGETDGYTADEVGDKKQFSWGDYKYANGEYTKLTKYCNKSSYGNDGYTDSLVTLEDIDDAAYKYTNGECNTPSKELFQELINNTVSEWTTQNGICGRLFTSKTNGNSIFIPVSGCCVNRSVLGVNYNGLLWGSSLSECVMNYAYELYFGNNNVDITVSNRYGGYSVRGVKTK